MTTTQLPRGVRYHFRNTIRLSILMLLIGSIELKAQDEIRIIAGYPIFMGHDPGAQSSMLTQINYSRAIERIRLGVGAGYLISNFDEWTSILSYNRKTSHLNFSFGYRIPVSERIDFIPTLSTGLGHTSARLNRYAPRSESHFGWINIVSAQLAYQFTDSFSASIDLGYFHSTGTLHSVPKILLAYYSIGDNSLGKYFYFAIGSSVKLE